MALIFHKIYPVFREAVLLILQDYGIISVRVQIGTERYVLWYWILPIPSQYPVIVLDWTVHDICKGAHMISEIR